MFVPGQVYRRRDLQERYGGQAQGGISTPAKRPFIMLFTGDSGEPYGYQDGWTTEGVFLYTGEGQRGDMDFVRGNRAIRDHIQDGKDLHLFNYTERGHVCYVGQMVCTGYQERRGPDVEGSIRRVIVFELTPIEDFLLDKSHWQTEQATMEARGLWSTPIDELRRRATAAAARSATPDERRVNARARSEAVRVYVLRRANGVCEGCGSPAPFRTPEGRPYLEPHHIRRLSDGGPDDPDWVAGVCPNCHRRAHYGEDRLEFNRHLADIVVKREAARKAGSDD